MQTNVPTLYTHTQGDPNSEQFRLAL